MLTFLHLWTSGLSTPCEDCVDISREGCCSSWLQLESPGRLPESAEACVSPH